MPSEYDVAEWQAEQGPNSHDVWMHDPDMLVPGLIWAGFVQREYVEGQGWAWMVYRAPSFGSTVATITSVPMDSSHDTPEDAADALREFWEQ